MLSNAWVSVAFCLSIWFSLFKASGTLESSVNLVGTTKCSFTHLMHKPSRRKSFERFPEFFHLDHSDDLAPGFPIIIVERHTTFVHPANLEPKLKILWLDFKHFIALLSCCPLDLLPRRWAPKTLHWWSRRWQRLTFRMKLLTTQHKN